MTNTCSGCPASWASLAYAHCSACHATFTTAKNFDKYRSQGVCRLPSDVGLELGERGAWKTPGPEGGRTWIR